jgi:hypothetical protein
MAALREARTWRSRRAMLPPACGTTALQRALAGYGALAWACSICAIEIESPG